MMEQVLTEEETKAENHETKAEEKAVVSEPDEQLPEMETESPAESVEQVDEDAKTIESNTEETIESGWQEVAQKLMELEKLFEERIAHTTFEEQSRVNMHKELQQYKEGMYGRIMQPLLMDIIALREDMLKTVSWLEKKSPEERIVSLEDFAEYPKGELSWLLEKYDVNSYQSEAGSEFSAHRHKAVKTLATDKKDEHGKIAFSLSNGYKYNDRVIYTERVVRYVYEEPNAAETEENNNE